ncbi:MAG: hypothetical protein IJI66_14040 [Erysipelotrichaceae bacterium]|nr:hypothetical protein [Erysipelotrichaceae bacterium]
MGYYAKFEGSLNLQSFQDTEMIEQLTSEVFEEESYNFIRLDKADKRILSIEFCGNEKYYEDEWWDFLNSINFYVKDGSVEFVGEDDSLWRFIKRNGSGEFVEEDGYVAYHTHKSLTNEAKNILIYDKDSRTREPLLFLKTIGGFNAKELIGEIWSLDGYTIDDLKNEIHRSYDGLVEIVEIDECIPF